MKKVFSCSIFLFLLAQNAFSANLKQFVNDCAYGVLGGAVAGVVSMAMTDKPSEYTRNIAIGASLGLYGGIGYGLYRINDEGSPYQDYVRVGVVRFDQKDSYGLTIHGTF